MKLRLIFSGVGFCLLAACNPQDTETPQGTKTIDASLDAYVADPSRKIFAQKVCNPLSGDDGEGAERLGINGRLYYLQSHQPRYAKASETIQFGTMLPAEIFMNRLFVPTRAWDRGFQTTDGSLLKNEKNETLFEYFGMELQARLKLSAIEAPGNYQLAILSDDGATVRLTDNTGKENLVIDNDDVHPTKMGCATQPIFMNYRSRIPFRIQYAQGPRYHVSLILMWRPVTSETNLNDPLCGRTGNDEFFNSRFDPSVPSANWQALLQRGWKPLEIDNYSLMQSTPNNPCGEVSIE